MISSSCLKKPTPARRSSRWQLDLQIAEHCDHCRVVRGADGNLLVRLLEDISGLRGVLQALMNGIHFRAPY